MPFVNLAREGTNGSGGITAAYEVASRGLKSVVRIVSCFAPTVISILAFQGSLLRLIESEREKGVTLTTLGFGTRIIKIIRLKSSLIVGTETTPTSTICRKLSALATKVASTIQLVAKDVKVQVAFDPTWVKRYRLIGYENRRLANVDFRNDKRDAGEMEPVIRGCPYEAELNPMKGLTFAVGEKAVAGPLAEVRFRYKSLGSATAVEGSSPFRFASMSRTFSRRLRLRMSAAVVEFAEILGASKHSQGSRFDEVIQVGKSAGLPSDADRLQFLSLVGMARAVHERSFD